MCAGKLVFAQVMDHLPLHTFRRCIACYADEHKVERFSCLDQYLCMAFARSPPSSTTWGSVATWRAIRPIS